MILKIKPESVHQLIWRISVSLPGTFNEGTGEHRAITEGGVLEDIHLVRLSI
jgi:hypothetical protein